MNIRQRIASTVNQRGLEFLGIVDLDLRQDFSRFKNWIDRHKHAHMQYLSDQAALRESPEHLLEGAQSVLVMALNYYQGDGGSFEEQEPKIAQYALIKDYHKILWRIGEEILDDVLEIVGKEHRGRVVVDSAPVLERALAAKTENGFIGKNTLYIHPAKGSFLLLAEIILTAKLPADIRKGIDPEKRSAEGGCGSCKRCQVHCPTGALDEAYQLDANKCLSYWTIEHRGTIPFEFWDGVGKYYFGCDICQLVCPYNRSAKPDTRWDKYRLKSIPELADMALMNQEQYESWFGGTSLTRAKREGLRRNALIAMTVTNHADLSRVIKICLNENEGIVAETARQSIEYSKSTSRP